MKCADCVADRRCDERSRGAGGAARDPAQRRGRCDQHHRRADQRHQSPDFAKFKWSTERIADVDQRLTALEARCEDLRRLENRVAVLQGQSMIHDDLLQTLQVVQRGYVLRDLSLFQRLRWLVCGR